MSKTKIKILEVSRTLFNEFGYSQVTIRMIALKLGMSSGNLNYHFKKREEILEALYFEMVSNFDERIDILPDTEITLTSVKNDIEDSMKRMVVYRFIWTDLFNILKANDKISSHFYEAHEKRRSGNFLLFEMLCSKGLMKPFTFKQEFLAELLINFGNTWIYTSAVYHKSFTNTYINKQANIMLAILYPYLTEKGILEFEKIS